MEFYKILSTECARKYFEKNGYNLQYILKINAIDEFMPGDYVKLEKQTGKLYQVKPFDTFEKIAQLFGCTAEELKVKNGIDILIPFSQIVVK